MSGRILTYLVGFILFFQAGYAQNKKIDSLILVLNRNTKEDTVRVKTLLSLAENYVQINSDTTRYYAEKALALSKKLIYKKGEALALKHIGRSYYDKKKNETVLDYWSQSLEIFKSINDSVGIANLQSIIGTIYSVDGMDAQAAKYYMDALAIAEQIKDTLRLATVLVNMGGLYNHKETTKPKALENYLRALPLLEGLNGQGSAIGTTLANIGDIYLWKKMYDSSIYFSNKALSYNSKTAQSAFALTMLGAANDSLGNYKEAVNFHLRADSVAVKFENARYQILAQLGLASAYVKMGNKQKAFESYKKAEDLAKGKGQNLNLASVYKGLAQLYEDKKDYFNAFRVQKSLTSLNDSLFSSEAQKELRNVVYDYEINKKQIEVNLYKKENDLAALELNRQKFAKNALIAGLGLVSLIIFILYRDYLNKARTNKLLDSQKAQIQSLLSNILPDEVAEELQRDGTATPKYYESASVLFTDFKSFTKHADHMTPQEVIAELNSCFIAFDDIMEKYNLEKIKTIGDAYMCAGGIPVPDPNHYWNMVKAAKDIQATILMRNKEREAKGLPPWEIRIGIHVGPIVAGVVGKKKYAYDIWGSTVNIASRMESNGEPGQINISAAVYELIKDEYECTHRGKIYAKNVGDIDMYFLGEKNEKTEQKQENKPILVG